MSQTILKGERLTAVVSTIVAIAILAAGVTAQQQHAAPRDILMQLESDVRFVKLYYDIRRAATNPSHFFCQAIVVYYGRSLARFPR